MRTSHSIVMLAAMGLSCAAYAQDGSEAHAHHAAAHQHHDSQTPPSTAATHAHDEQGTSPAPSGHGHDTHAMDDTSNANALPPNDHVPPAAPATTLPPMSTAHMADMMQMHDLARRGMVLVDRLERTRTTAGDYATAWEAQGWYGSDTRRIWLRTEGERDARGTQDARLELLGSAAIATFWDIQAGVRHDAGQGPDRQWLAVGVQGLAPYWFETQATFYVGSQGRTALRLEASYDLRFTQRLILAPELEANLYGKDDPARGVRAGLSDVEAGLRLRYEFSRRFAPYVGVGWTRRFADASSRHGEPSSETRWMVGVRMWL